MAVSLPAIIGALSLAVLASSAAPQAALQSTQSVNPIVIEGWSANVGDSWTYRNYQTDTGNTNRTWVSTVLAADEEGYTIRRVDRLSNSNREQPAIDSNVRFGEGYLNFPLYVGKSWQSINTTNGKAVTSNFRVVASEVIDTSVGSVETLKIESWSTIGGPDHRLVWFAPSVQNFVRLRYVGNPQATEMVSYRLSGR